jgi:hypothetical protein
MRGRWQKYARIPLTGLSAHAANFSAASDHVATLWIELLAASAASSFPQDRIILLTVTRNPEFKENNPDL